MQKRNSSLQHFEFLADPTSEPRLTFIEKLISDTSSPGDILTYNQSFEISRLKELALDFLKFSKEILKRIDRIKDLMTPFQQRIYYKHTMHGSYSIKQVLPALVPELSYDSLAISNGGDASLAFERMIFDRKRDHSELRKQMLDYCGMDTLAMVRILGKLSEM